MTKPLNTQLWQCSSSWWKNATLTFQPPYLPDLAPCDFWLFPRLNVGLQHQRFATVEDIKCSVTASYTQYHRRISTSASKHGKTIGASVCVCRRDVLWGWLDWKALHFNYESMTAEFWELSDTPTYLLDTDLYVATWMSNPESNRIYFVNIS